MNDKPKVLLIAEAANPEWFSVPLVGWSHARALVELIGAHVVTQVRNKEAMERVGWREGREFTAIDSERVAKPMHALDQRLRKVGLGWTTTTALQTVPYYYFERLFWKRFGARIAAGEFDVVHRLTPLSPTNPSRIAGKCAKAGTPFVWGPINGGVAWPKGFGGVRRSEGEWLSYVRDFYKMLPGYRGTRRHAAAIIVGSSATWQQMPTRYHDKCVYTPENAIDPRRFHRVAEGRVKLPLRVAFVGRLVPYKGASMLLEAAAPLIRDGKLVVDIIGDGEEMPVLRELVATEGLEAGVKLEGWVAHEQLQERLMLSDVFGFPSIREFGGAVVLEAMALGLVPVVVDYAGPAELVTTATGFRVPLGDRAQLVAGFRERLTQMVADPASIREMGRRARERVLSLFTWEAKAKQTLEVYRWVLGHREKPNLGMPFPDAEGTGY